MCVCVCVWTVYVGVAQKLVPVRTLPRPPPAKPHNRSVGLPKIEPVCLDRTRVVQLSRSFDDHPPGAFIHCPPRSSSFQSDSSLRPIHKPRYFH